MKFLYLFIAIWLVQNTITYSQDFYWAMNVCGDTVARDSQKHHTHFKLKDVTSAMGYSQQAAFFNGATSRGLAKLDSVWQGEFTMNLWVSPTFHGNTSSMGIFSSRLTTNQQNSVSAGSFQLEVVTTTVSSYQYQLRLTNHKGKNVLIPIETFSYQQKVSNLPIEGDLGRVWTQIAISCVKMNEEYLWKVYANGILKSSSLQEVAPYFERFVLGVDRNGRSFYQGKIDEVSLYRKGLSDAEVQDLATLPYYPDNCSLLEGLQWSFDSCEGEKAKVQGSIENDELAIHLKGSQWSFGYEHQGLFLDGKKSYAKTSDFVRKNGEENVTLGKTKGGNGVSFSLAFWLKPFSKNIAENASIIASYSESFTKETFLLETGSVSQGTAGMIQLLLKMPNGVVKTIPLAKITENWQHWFILADGGDWKVFVNGQKQVLTKESLQLVSPVFEAIRIGQSRAGKASFYGWVDEVRWYNYIVSGQEIESLSSTPSQSSFCAPLHEAVVDYLPCDTKNKGSIHLNAYQGVRPFTYSWSDTSFTFQGNQKGVHKRNGLNAGSYQVTITGADGAVQKYRYLIGNHILWKDNVGTSIEEIDSNKKVKRIVHRELVNGWGNAGITSHNRIEEGQDGFVSFVVDSLSLGSEYRIGLSEQNVNEHPYSILYGFQVENGKASVWLGEYLLQELDNVRLGDVMSISRKGGILYYLYNADTVQRFAVENTERLLVDVSLKSGVLPLVNVSACMPISWDAKVKSPICLKSGAKLGKIRLQAKGGSGDFEYLWEHDGRGGQSREQLGAGDYKVTLIDKKIGIRQTRTFSIGYAPTWVEMKGLEHLAGESSTFEEGQALAKNDSNGVWWTSGAYSENILGSGENGWISFQMPEDSLSIFAVGFSYATRTQNPTRISGLDEIAYTVALQQGKIHLYQQGNDMGEWGEALAGDQVKFVKEGEWVKLYKNGEALVGLPVHPSNSFKVHSAVMLGNMPELSLSFCEGKIADSVLVVSHPEMLWVQEVMDLSDFGSPLFDTDSLVAVMPSSLLNKKSAFGLSAHKALEGNRAFSEKDMLILRKLAKLSSYSRVLDNSAVLGNSAYLTLQGYGEKLIAGNKEKVNEARDAVEGAVRELNPLEKVGGFVGKLFEGLSNPLLGNSIGKLENKVHETLEKGVEGVINETGLRTSATTAIPDNNYIRVYNAKIEGFTTVDALTTATKEQVSVGTDYMDGLGRVVQSIQKQGSVAGQDVVQVFDYDVWGRQTKAYLPYVATGSTTGTYRSAGLTEQASFYAASSTKDYATSAYPYASTQYENSARGIVQIERPVGINTDLQSNVYEWKGNDTYYHGGVVYRWFTDQRQGEFLAKKASVYAEGELMVKVISAKATTTLSAFEFYNHLGQLVLKRNATKVGTFLDTYYVYDDFGNLRFILTPLATQALLTMSSCTAGSNYFTCSGNPSFRELIHQYEYDERNRTITEKAPSEQAIHFVYDKLNRLILSQDGSQRGRNEWAFTKYDKWDRPVLSGILTSTNTRATWQSGANSATQLFVLRAFETSTGTLVQGYRDNTYPSIATGATVTSISYFDDYNFDGDASHVADVSYNSAYNANVGYASNFAPYPYTKGMATGSRVLVLGSSPAKWLTTIQFYDIQGRVIQTSTEHHTGGKDVLTMRYDRLSGRVISSYQVHQQLSNGTPVNVLKTSTYDHEGRALVVSQKFNNETAVNLASYAYNTIGQVKGKNMGGLEEAVYQYNIRGWLTQMNDVQNVFTAGQKKLFAFKLDYETNSQGISSFIPQYNGNIAAQVWASATTERIRGYTYNYSGDYFNRMTGATYSAKATSTGTWGSVEAGAYSVSNLTYDDHGNIKTLTRNGLRNDGTFGVIDQLTYYYKAGNANQLWAVDDAATTNGISPSPDFDDTSVKSSSGATQEYFYDGIGRLTKDRNKRLSHVAYNHLDMPTRIDFESAGNYIEYGYDAAGIRLWKKVYKASSLVKTIDYLGDFVYENGSLSFVHTSEGRAIKAGANFRYEYHYQDHLGNLRVAFAGEREWRLSAEPDRKAQEEATFLSLSALRSMDRGYNSAHSAKLLTSQSVSTDFIDVRKGHTFDISGIFYQEASAGARLGENAKPSLNWSMGVPIVGSTSQLLPNQEKTNWTPQVNVAATIPFLKWALQGKKGKDTRITAVESYVVNLNIKYYRKDKTLHSESNSTLGTNQGTWNTITWGRATVPNDETIAFVKISLVNISSNTVYLDEWLIKSVGIGIIQEVHYEPLGTELYGLQRTSNSYHNYLYQGKEYETDNELFTYDFHARQYDAQLGRWHATDPARQFANPYLAMGNNWVVSIDPDGREIITAMIVGAMIGTVIGAIRASNSNHSMVGGMWRGALIGAIGGALSAFGGGTFLANVAWGAGEGAITGALDALLWGEDVGKGALYGAATGAIFATVQSTSQSIKNYREGYGFGTHDGVFNRMVDEAVVDGAVDARKAQKALDFWTDRFGGPALDLGHGGDSWTYYNDYNNRITVHISEQRFLGGGVSVRRSIAHEHGHYVKNVVWQDGKVGGTAIDFKSGKKAAFNGHGWDGYRETVRYSGRYHIGKKTIEGYGQGLTDLQRAHYSHAWSQYPTQYSSSKFGKFIQSKARYYYMIPRRFNYFSF
jgi:RHS repeat-associated protein